MHTYEVSYSTWKQLASTLGTAVAHVWRGIGTQADHSAVGVYVGHRSMLFVAEVGAADEADWIANYQPTSIESANDGEAAASILVSIVEDSPKRPTMAGMAAVTVMDIPPDAGDYFESFEIECPPEIVTFLDIAIADTLVGPQDICWLVGGSYKVRTDAAHGSALHLSLVDRDDMAGVFAFYGMVRTQISVAGLVGDASTAVRVRGVTSGAVSGLLADLGANAWAITYYSGYTDGSPTEWAPGEQLEFLDAGGIVVATGNNSAWTEGDVLLIQTHVRNKWIEGKESGEMKPGGTKLLPAGFYLRITTYNADAVNDMRVTVELQVGLQ